MVTARTVSDIYTALAAVMADVDHVAKRDRNEHQRFLFRGIDAVVNAVGPALRKHGVIVVPRVDTVDYDTVATSTGKPATACRVLVTYTFFAPDGSSIDTCVAAEAWDSGDKAAPKAMSVAFRTALLQALALPTDDPEPDAQTYERAPATQAAPPASAGGKAAAKATRAQVTKIQVLAGELGLDRDQRLAGIAAVIGHPVESSKDLTPKEASDVIERMTAKVAAAQPTPPPAAAEPDNPEGLPIEDPPEGAE